MNPALETLKERGFFQQCTDVEGLSRTMDEGPITFYVGCDPTGSSLHIGHMVPFFAFRHLRQAGHRGIALIGGGTARIGDPSGKTEMRKMLSYEQLDANAESIRAQLDRFIGFDGKTALTDNNKNWLADLNYIDFLRDIGRHFSVNRMLSFEAYRLRMETGLSFIEFNYQLLQSYDFLELYRRHGCRLQIGGDDQWGNIVAGIELIRRVEGAECYGLTFPLVTTSDGKKMGKTEKGAIFLDPAMTSPYEFFQYWRNIQDADLRRFLLMFTFLPTAEIDALCAPGKNPNEGKERLAYEVTALIHGPEEAEKALAGARAAFGGGGDKSAMPSVELPRSRFEQGYNVVDLFCDAGLVPTKSEGRRLVQQGGAFVTRVGGPFQELETIGDVTALIGSDRITEEGELLLRAGKKRYCRVVVKG
ncbi:tyrosine--tRNA ligase [Treponema sp. J25]|uniref:tyrosine--tRNA ligase n=1 Tax=Treponema sp. J25 TaxID=2094121 RepID=UPI00104D106B|nr:tyrosine--tRNA ligase [Treponema sp. J25]TCW60424.1 tyrosine--tRNA ligase [Treponema sp. J25]